MNSWTEYRVFFKNMANNYASKILIFLCRGEIKSKLLQFFKLFLLYFILWNNYTTPTYYPSWKHFHRPFSLNFMASFSLAVVIWIHIHVYTYLFLNVSCLVCIMLLLCVISVMSIWHWITKWCKFTRRLFLWFLEI